MNTDISTRPAYLDQFGPEDAFADVHGFVRPPRISMLNDRFNPLDENGDPALPPSLQVQVIMLQENDTRIYYPAGEYEPDSATPPSCYSDNKVTPSDGAQQPQHATCAGCPRSVRDIPSFNGKTTVSACKERYKVACLVAGAKGKVFLLDIGPASRRAYGAYFNFLKQHHAKANQVITTLDYADKAFQFSFAGWINPSTAEMVKGVYETDEPAMVVNAFDKPRQLAIAAPKAQEWGDKVTIAPKDAPAVQAAVQHFDDKWTANPMKEFVNRVADGAFGSRPTQEEMAAAPKRRGRPPKDTPPEVRPNESFVGAGPIPAATFAAPSTPQPSAPAPKPNGFGMEAAKAPPEDLQAALNRAFMK